jgi:hypothetical protein
MRTKRRSQKLSERIKQVSSKGTRITIVLGFSIAVSERRQWSSVWSSDFTIAKQKKIMFLASCQSSVKAEHFQIYRVPNFYLPCIFPQEATGECAPSKMRE